MRRLYGILRPWPLPLIFSWFLTSIRFWIDLLCNPTISNFLLLRMESKEVKQLQTEIISEIMNQSKPLLYKLILLGVLSWPSGSMFTVRVKRLSNAIKLLCHPWRVQGYLVQNHSETVIVKLPKAKTIVMCAVITYQYLKKRSGWNSTLTHLSSNHTITEFIYKVYKQPNMFEHA